MAAPARATLGFRARRYGLRCERATLWLFWLRGWDLVARNLKCGRFELDLLLARGDDLRVVEVKARAAGAWVPWPGRITFQRVSWSGWRCRFHPQERWDALRLG